jgi:replication factor A1
VKVSDYNTRSIGSVMSTVFEVNPTIDEANTLRGWYESGGSGSSTSMSVPGGSFAGGGQKANVKDERKTFTQIKDEGLGVNQADFFQIRGTITMIKHDNQVFYNACHKCNRKVQGDDSKGWNCENCREHYEKCAHKYILSLSAADHTGSAWLSAFNDAGKIILNKDASEMAVLREQDPTQYETVFMDAGFHTFTFKVRSKAEEYNEEKRVKNTIVKAEPTNFVEESRFLIAEIAKYDN